MSVFRLGDFSFINLTRALSRPVERLEREIRLGTSGVTFWRTGKRGEPFQLASVADVADVDAAQDLLAEYEDLVGGDPVNAIWADRAHESLVVVHNVMPLEGGLHATLIGIGGLLGSSNALLRAVWLVETIDPFVSSQ